MKMSVFRQGQRLEQVDHLDCVRTAAGKEAINMIMHARLHNATVLVGLQSGECVIKPYEESDEALSFEALYDTAISIFDFNRMSKQKVRTREELAPYLYEVELLLVPSEPISIKVHLKGHIDTEVSATLKRLLREDKQFGRELYSHLVAGLITTEAGAIEVMGPFKIAKEAPADAPEWEFIKS